MPKRPTKAAAKQEEPIERPEWVLDTPMMFYTLEARVANLDVDPLTFELTLEEFDALKTQLARMRGFLPEVAHA